MQEQTCEWKQYPKNMNNQLYTYSEEKDVVLDPFLGRGTTILEACLMNRVGIGNDKNILANLLTKAKCDVPNKGWIVSRINKLQHWFNPNNITITNIEPNIRMIFSDYTLKQIIYLKNNLKWRKSNVDNFISAMVLGIMHGNSEGYLSLSMPNTFSMAPNYVKNYISEHNLHRPNRNVFELLKKKLNRCYQKPKVKGKSYNQDVTRMTRIKDSTINLIVTSPPYTRVIRYGQFNWIRLWFLGKSGKEVDEDLYFSQSIGKYCKFMTDSLKEMKRVLKSNGV